MTAARLPLGGGLLSIGGMAREAAAQARAGMTEEALPGVRASTFHSLRYRDYRYLFQGQIGAAASNWME